MNDNKTITLIFYILSLICFVISICVGVYLLAYQSEKSPVLEATLFGTCFGGIIFKHIGDLSK